jgi:hypothetical protein
MMELLTNNAVVCVYRADKDKLAKRELINSRILDEEKEDEKEREEEESGKTVDILKKLKEGKNLVAESFFFCVAKMIERLTLIGSYLSGKGDALKKTEGQGRPPSDISFFDQLIPVSYISDAKERISKVGQVVRNIIANKEDEDIQEEMRAYAGVKGGCHRTIMYTLKYMFDDCLGICTCGYKNPFIIENKYIVKEEDDPSPISINNPQCFYPQIGDLDFRDWSFPPNPNNSADQKHTIKTAAPSPSPYIVYYYDNLLTPVFFSGHRFSEIENELFKTITQTDVYGKGKATLLSKIPYQINNMPRLRMTIDVDSKHYFLAYVLCFRQTEQIIDVELELIWRRESWLAY